MCLSRSILAVCEAAILIILNSWSYEGESFVDEIENFLSEYVT